MEETPLSTAVKVITGIGGMGRAIARRLGSGSTLVLADYSAEALASAAQDLRDEGHQVITREVDVSGTASVAALTRAAADAGPVTTVVHTAGLSPVQAAPGAPGRGPARHGHGAPAWSAGSAATWIPRPPV
jgi:NADP-dependent 3-hydroxy acid dehydrogenase YdfG